MTTLKQRVKNAQGKEVHSDYFLFSCLERERMIKYLGTQYWQELRWPVLDNGDPAAAVADKDLAQLVDGLCAWYSESFESLRSNKALDYEHLNEVVPPFVDLTHDLFRVSTQKTGDRFPASNDTEEDAINLWNGLRSAIQKCFPGYSHLFIKYLEWAYAIETVEQIEIGSRPPVGRYAPPMRLRQGGTGPGSRPPRPDSRPPRRGGPGDGPRGPGRGENRDGPRPPRGEGRPPRRDFDGPPRHGSGGGNRGGEGRNEGRGRGGRPDGERGERSAELERTAMDDVEQALQQLRGNPDVQQVRLKPANSYYRRLQHKQAVDEGFSSESVGDGADRSVMVVRGGEGQAPDHS